MPMSDDYGTSDAEARISIRELALGCGDLHGKILPMVSALAKLSEDELIERGKADLAELRSRGRLTDPEMGQLLDVLRVIRTDASPRERSDQVDDILQQIRTSGGSPFALAIATIAADTSRTMAQRSEVEGVDEVAFRASAGVVTAADIVGGIGGVLVGAELCGVPCGVVGGAAGALGLSILAQEHL